jgi:DNA excision repair protein ERCC-2
MGVHSRAQELMSRYLESGLELHQQDPVLQLSQMVSNFVQALDNIGEEFFLTLTPDDEGGTLRLTCCDASKWLRESYEHFANVAGFSATLKPFEYYSELLGLGSDATTAEFESPFPRTNRKLLVIPQISTKMRDRANNYGKIKDTIERLVSLKSGNYFVFFPSFDFMNRVLSQVQLPGFRVLAQEREMRREAVNHYLDMLREKVPTVIFAVQGGVFAEGVDYPGDMLIGALIVGPALPVFDFERELLREYFERKHGNGFDYAYTYPAMARVVQSAGRVIRSSHDRGLIVLMDRRFVHEAYRKSMPRDWTADDEGMVSNQILGDVRRFWEQNEP